VTSEIILGGTQVCEHGLGLGGANTWGGWSGTYGAGVFVTLANVSLTVSDGAGSYVSGAATLTCYTGVPGTTFQGATEVDGGGPTVWGLQFFNNASEHTPWSFNWYAFLTPGSHSILVGIYVNGGTVTFDANDGGTFISLERP